MTTIASDGNMVAADSLRVGGGEVIDQSTPKLRFFDGSLFGFTGCMALFEPAMRWYKAGAVPGEQPVASMKEGHWSLYRFTKAGATRYSHDLPYPELMPYPFSAGSGCDYAMGALHAGASPRQAIEIAGRLDVYTGGNILEYAVRDHYPVVEQDGDVFRIASRSKL
jgi:ATP-dependent HslUV protease subunit HslV